MNENTLTIGVCSIEKTKQRMMAAFCAEADATPRYCFGTREDLLRTLSPNRWSLLEALTGAGPLGVRELARRVSRDVKGVHADTQRLVLCGLINKTDDGKLHFPFGAVHVDFMLRAA